MKLQAENRIRVHGWVMLAGLEDGEYTVKAVNSYNGQPSYCFRKPRGKRIVARHFASSVDAWIRPAGHPDLNRIEILS